MQTRLRGSPRSWTLVQHGRANRNRVAVGHARGSAMMRFSAIFIAICMMLIAGSTGAVLYLSFGFARVEAAVVAVAVLTALAIANAMTARARDRANVGDQIADLSRGTADLARQVGEIGRRLAAVEAEMAAVSHKAKVAAEPLAREIELLGSLVKELAESVAAHESALS